MMAGKHKMKAKYRKDKQTDTSALLSILAMSILLALSTDRGHCQSGMGKWRDPDVTKPQYTERVYGRTHFPDLEKYRICH